MGRPGLENGRLLLAGMHTTIHNYSLNVAYCQLVSLCMSEAILI